MPSAFNTGDVITTAANTDLTLLMANKNRRWAAICNDGAADAYVQIGKSAVVGTGIRINAGGGSVVFDDHMPYLGEIHGVSAGVTNLMITEVDQ